MSRIYVALDIEATGTDPDRDAIIEIGAVKFRDDEVLDTLSSFVDPARPLPYRIQQLTGIAPEDLEGAPSLFDVLPQLTRFVGQHPVVGHSVPFDLAFFRRHGALLDNAPVDTFELASLLVPHAARYSLVQLATELDIDLPAAHRALDDARAAKDLFLRLADRLQRLDAETLQEIGKLAARADWPLKVVFQDAARRRTRNTFSGSIAQQLLAKGAFGDDTLGLLVGDEEPEPLEPAPRLTPLDVDGLSDLLADGGRIAESFPGYEHRPQQVEMLRAVAESFNHGRVLLVEASTGVGKSLAYLVPAVHHAVHNGRRVVISTNTINLQDQLHDKDLPALADLLNLRFRVAVMKGRSNYLCRHRLDMLRQRDDLSQDEIRLLIKVLAWLPSTTTGDVAELPLRGKERAAWYRVSAETEHCNPDVCPYARDGRDFFYRARQRAEAAHILIVNHALLLSDMLSENRVLPAYEYLIVDEAHHLEDQATSQLGFKAEQSDIETVLTALAGTGQSSRPGFLSNLGGRIQHSELSTQEKKRASEHIKTHQRTVQRMENRLYQLFNGVERFAEERAEEGRQTGYHERHYRLTSGMRIQPAWDGVTIAWDDMRIGLNNLTEGLSQLYTSLASDEAESVPQRDAVMGELAGYGRRLEELRAGLNAIIADPALDGIQWVTWQPKWDRLSLNSAPLHVGETLNQHLFANRVSTILTSATLQVNESFDYTKDRLGLWNADELSVGSPFNYRASTLLYVPTDIPEPGQPYYQKTVEKAMVELNEATQGRTLALFTSHSQLQTTYRAISRPLGQSGIAVLGQGLDGSRAHLLETFKTEEETVLLGTRSFWEGVDVVGPALSCLVIARLPFDVPTDPVFAARSETFDNPFMEYAVPQAVLRFRQGFGRLIRSKTDRGIVVLLDKRVLTKRYGRVFLDSLPACTLRQGPLNELPEAAAGWIDDGERARAVGEHWRAGDAGWDEEYF
ncbi:MAG: putative ATP-dependent helicase DinG [Anaerolineales bacterium]|nr:putative ATP-dependent helicase DinG [Anaerolineales bacterium]